MQYQSDCVIAPSRSLYLASAGALDGVDPLDQKHLRVLLGLVDLAVELFFELLSVSLLLLVDLVDFALYSLTFLQLREYQLVAFLLVTL